MPFGKLSHVITRTLFARGAASLILAGALVLGTAGCTFITSQATLNEYDPTDGVAASLGDIQVRNVVGIIGDDGHAINLMITIVNEGSADHLLNIQFTAGGEKTTVAKIAKAGTTTTFGTTPDEEQIVVLNPDVAAGALLPVYLQWGKEAGREILVPVLEATGDYAELAPPAILR